MTILQTNADSPVVLLVDDSEIVLAYLRKWFEENGWTVLEAINEEQMDLAFQGSHVDAVVLDRRWHPEGEHMPFGGHKGDFLMQRIASRWPYVGVVVYTAYPEESVETRMTRHGAFQVINKNRGVDILLLACCLGVIWKRIQFVRDQSISWIAFAETVNAIERGVIPFLRDGRLPSPVQPISCEIVTLLPGGLGRLHLSGGKVAEVAVSETIRKQSSPVLVDPSGSDESLCILGLAKPQLCGSRLIAAIYEREVVHSERRSSQLQQSVQGFVLFESPLERAFNEYHIDVAMSLASLLSEALIREKAFVATGTKERSDEREELLLTVAQGISDSLQVSQSFLDSAKRSLSTDHVSPGMLEILHSNIDSACNGIEDSVSMVNRLHREATERVANVELTDMRAVIESTLSRVQALGNSFACEIVWEPPSEALDVFIDIEEFEDGLFTLLKQSIRAAVQANSGHTDEVAVEIRLCQIGTGIVLRITDNGLAVPEDQLPWVFQRMFSRSFPTPNDQRNPSGLCRLHRHVEHIGGSAAALVDDTGRTTFEFVLPIAAVSKHIPV